MIPEPVLKMIKSNKYLNDEELIALNKLAKVIVCPYKSASQSGIVLTTFAFGKPVIASNLPQISEFVRDGVHGYLCPANNIRTWSKCILLLVNNIKLRRKMGLNSKKMAKKHFGKENFVKSYQKILH